MPDTSTRPRAVIVTGAASGIGRAIATEAARAGIRVLAVDSDADSLDALCADNPDIVPMAGDVGAEATAARAVQAALDAFGRLDGIVSNAGVFARAPLSETTGEDWRRILDINLSAAFHFARAGEAALRDGGGSMVLIASTRALMSEPDTFAYSASKGGLVALAHSLAVSLGPDVRVNAISPGWIDTSGEDLSPEDHTQHPAGRVGRPEDVAELALYLLDGARSGFMTGENLVLDGGMTRKMIYAE